ncbi:unnamed protein product, partial [Coregonus sp. 'balchen']
NYYLKKREHVVALASDTGRLKDLMNEIQEKNFKIECMSEQLREYEERIFTKISSEGVEDLEKEWLKQVCEKLKDYIDSMQIVMEQVCNSLEAKEQRLEDQVLNIEKDTTRKKKLSAEKEKQKG